METICSACKGFFASTKAILSCAYAINVVMNTVCLVLAILVSMALIPASQDNTYALPVSTQYKSLVDSLGLRVEMPISVVNLIMLFKSILIGIQCLLIFNAIVGLIGCIGIYKRSKVLTSIYIIVQVVNFIALVTLFSLLRGGRTKLAAFKDTLQEDLNENYEGIGSNNTFSIMMNSIMTSSNCCGLNGFEDFQQTKWNQTRNILGTNTVLPKERDMPLACCSPEGLQQVLSKVGQIVASNLSAIQPDDLSCTLGNNTLNNKSQGCYDIIWDIVEEITNSVYFVLVFSVIFFLMLVNILLSIYALLRMTIS